MPHQLLFPKIHISRIAGSPISYLPSPISCEAQPDPDLIDSLVLQRPKPVSEFRFSHSEFPQSAIPNPHSDFADSLVLQRPEPKGFVNVTVNVNEDPEPYRSLVNCFIFFAHLFPYVLIVALAVWRS